MSKSSSLRARRAPRSRQWSGKGGADHRRSIRPRMRDRQVGLKEPEKGHKLVDYAGRCIDVPDNQGEAIYSEDCVGKYEYQPDGSWKGSGSCTRNFKSGDHITDTWEEGSHLKVNVYKTTGGTGKYQGATGGGTYTYGQSYGYSGRRQT